MKYGIKNVQSQAKGKYKEKVFIVFDSQRECKEDWIFQCYTLDLGGCEKPFETFAKFLESEYESFRFGWRFYIEPIKQIFRGPTMPVAEFAKKSDAQKFASLLNEKLEEKGLYKG